MGLKNLMPHDDVANDVVAGTPNVDPQNNDVVAANVDGACLVSGSHMMEKGQQCFCGRQN